jgi:sugar phosphate isomerase/epimerase
MDHKLDRIHLSPDSIGLSRRSFLALAAASAASVSLPSGVEAASTARGSYKGKLCFFSKPLPDMDWRRLAQSVKRMGFDGVDLTVRKGGHVKPERAAEDLPKAVAIIREEGLEVPMITTALTSADDPTARPILSTAGKLGIPFFKVGYYLYEFADVRKELQKAGEQFRGLVEVAKQCGIQAGYHNHSEYIGAALWDAAQFIEPLDPKWAGYYLDSCHLTGEGSVGAWKSALHLAVTRLKMVAAKDFYWKRTAEGREYTVCPLGEGWVDWKYFLGVLAQHGFQGPISLHIEYFEGAGGTPAAKEGEVLLAGQRDLEFLRARLREAYGEA